MKTDFLLIVVMVIAGASHLTTLQAANNGNPLLIANLGDPFSTDLNELKRTVLDKPYFCKGGSKKVINFLTTYWNRPGLIEDLKDIKLLKGVYLYRITSPDTQPEQQKLLLMVMQRFPEMVAKKFEGLCVRKDCINQQEKTKKVNYVFAQNLLKLDEAALENIPENAGPPYEWSKLAVLANLAAKQTDPNSRYNLKK